MTNSIKDQRMKALGCLLVAGALATGAAFTQPVVAQSTTPAASEETKKLYVAQCQACHGPNGKAMLPDMAFVDRAWKHGTSTADMAKVITEGVPGTMMMPFKGRLTEEQIRDLARYVRSLDPKLKPEKK